MCHYNPLLIWSQREFWNATSGRNKTKFKSGQSYTYIMRKVWYHQIWIQIYFRFHCVRPNEYTFKLPLYWNRFFFLMNSKASNCNLWLGFYLKLGHNWYVHTFELFFPSWADIGLNWISHIKIFMNKQLLKLNTVGHILGSNIFLSGTDVKCLLNLLIYFL